MECLWPPLKEITQEIRQTAHSLFTKERHEHTNLKETAWVKSKLRFRDTDKSDEDMQGQDAAQVKPQMATDIVSKKMWPSIIWLLGRSDVNEV